MCEWPLRHHWPDEVPLAMSAMDRPSGEGAALNSFRYRSQLTSIGVPPVAATRKMSFWRATSLAGEEK